MAPVLDPDPDPTEPDATPVDPPGELPARMLISRGAVGTEALYALEGSREVAISTPGGAPWCGGKLFCNLPPDSSVGRFVGAQFVGVDRAHPRSQSRPRS